MPDLMVDLPDDDGDVIVRDTNERPKPITALQDNTAGFDELRAQLDAERKKGADATRLLDEADRRATEADARARRATADAETARTDARTARDEGRSGKKLAIDNAISATNSALDASETEYAAAMEAGDWKKAATHQRRMGELSGELAQLKAGKAAIDADPPEEPKARSRPVEREEPKPQTRAEQFEAELRKYSAPVQSWIRKHPEVIDDQVKHNMAMAAHHNALARGYQPESEAYFSHLDRELGYAAAEPVRSTDRVRDAVRAAVSYTHLTLPTKA